MPQIGKIPIQQWLGGADLRGPGASGTIFPIAEAVSSALVLIALSLVASANPGLDTWLWIVAVVFVSVTIWMDVKRRRSIASKDGVT